MTRERITRVQPVAVGTAVERLVAHPRLPLLAGLDERRPAVHVWEVEPEALRARAVVGAEAPPYVDDEFGHDRFDRRPGVAWHPSRPQLLVTTAAGLHAWSPDDGLVAVGAAPHAAALELVEPYPSFPVPQEWLDRSRRWSVQNVAVAARAGCELLVGTPDGTVVALRSGRLLVVEGFGDDVECDPSVADRVAAEFLECPVAGRVA